MTNIASCEEKYRSFFTNSESDEQLYSICLDFYEHLEYLSRLSWLEYKQDFAEVLTFLSAKIKWAIGENLHGLVRSTRLLLSELLAYLKQLPILAYNATFDLRSLQNHLVRIIYSRLSPSDQSTTKAKSIKALFRNGKFLTFGTSTLKFLDCTSYLGIPMPLSTFLDNMNTQSGRKLKIPYQFLTGHSDLEYPGFPHYLDPGWNSLLHGGGNILGSPDWEQYSALLESGLSREGALRKIGLSKPPQSPAEEWEELHEYYMEVKMCSNLWDIVEVYLYHDIGPFLEACEKMASQYERLFFHS